MLALEMVGATAVMTVRKLDAGTAPAPRNYLALLIVFSVLSGVAVISDDWAVAAEWLGGLVLLQNLMRADNPTDPASDTGVTHASKYFARVINGAGFDKTQPAQYSGSPTENLTTMLGDIGKGLVSVVDNVAKGIGKALPGQPLTGDAAALATGAVLEPAKIGSEILTGNFGQIPGTLTKPFKQAYKTIKDVLGIK